MAKIKTPTRSEKLKRINFLLGALMLSGMKECLEEVLEKSIKEELEFEDMLLELLQAENISRENNRVERFLRQSKLPLEKSLNNFDLKRLPLKISRQFKALLEGSFLDRQENVLVFGQPGAGKSHLLCALGIALVHKSRRVYFTTCSFLVQELLKAKGELKLESHLKKLSKFDALIIDDIGYVQQSQEEMEVLFSLLAYRYERGSVMLTSNLSFSKWDKIFKDKMTTAAAIDRLVHHCVIIDLTGVSSYRMENAKSRKDVNT